MNKKNLIIVIVCLLVVAGASFYAGMSYSKKGGVSKNKLMNFDGNSVQGQRVGQNGIARKMGQGNGAGAINGEVLSKDDKSITVKLRDGGSKIVFFAASTTISKSVDGTKEDLGAGKSVMIFGSTNSDGSVSAQSIQLRDSIATPNIPKDNK